MKKYNLSAIMKKAWELVKTLELTISAALKASWKLAKEAMEKKYSLDTQKSLKTDVPVIATVIILFSKCGRKILSAASM